MNLAVVVLAAGQSTRMKSKLVKVLHPIAGRPLLAYSLDAAQEASSSKPVVVVGYQSDRIRASFGDRAEYVEQPERLGTADAVKRARPLLEHSADDVLVFYGDMPLLKGSTLSRLVARHTQSAACLTMLTVVANESMGFGRVLRDANGRVLRIVEEIEASPEERAITELNPGIYCFKAEWLWEHLERIRPAPKKGEFYLTDLLELAVAQRVRVETQMVEGVSEVIGVNDRVQLALAEKVMQVRVRERVMLGGATLVDPTTTFVDFSVEVGEDSVILPGSYLQGATKIGADCRIGPNAIVRDSVIGDGCIVGGSVIESSILEDHVEIGPFCHLRPGAYLSRKVHLGNYAEVKNSHLGEGVHMGHFSYLGDADVGARVNYAAGAITCNYDGKNKHRTIIGEDAFIGSDTMLVAPVTIGARARTGAGAVVTKDVPPDTVAVGVPARIIRKNP